MESTSLVLKLPEAFAGRAVCFRSVEEHRVEPGQAGPHGGRGQAIYVHAGSKAASLVLDGPKDNLAIRKKGDEDLALEVDHRRMSPNNSVTFWCVGLHEPKREWACRFCMNDDGTISPCDKGQPCKDLVIGVQLGEGWKRDNLVLVHPEDSERRVVFLQGAELAASMEELAEASSRADITKEHRLIITSPNLSWLGASAMGICVRGSGFEVATGRGFDVKIGKASDAVVFAYDGVETDCMAVRKHDDQSLGLDVAHRKIEPGSNLNLWNCGGKKEHAVEFAFAADRSLTIFGHTTVALGVKRNTDNLVLVSSDDPMKLIFQTPQEEEATAQLLREEAAAAKAAWLALEESALARCNAEMFERLRIDGLVHIPGAVSRDLVIAAKKEINRQLGCATSGTDQFKAKMFPTRPEITNLFNASSMPFILQRLLGPRAHGPYRAESGQIALRFPGDMCIKDTVESDYQNFQRIRRGWHIDGTPSNLIPGVTDHWGKITNFDALVGVLLSDTDETMSGELCCYPGSHMDLSSYFHKNGLDAVANKGAEGLPNGQQTDSVLQKLPTHCNGKAGDVFLANYMVAHFIAPNTSPDIRYAVYFRIRGPSFDLHPLNKESMLHPLMNWSLDGPEAPKPAAQPSLRPAATLEEVDRLNKVLDYYATANNDYTAPSWSSDASCPTPA